MATSHDGGGASDATSVRVALRVRPLGERELREGAQPALAVQDEINTVVLGSGASERSFGCVGAPRSCASAAAPRVRVKNTLLTLPTLPRQL